MIFVSIVIALALELLVNHPQRIRNMSWLSNYRKWILSLFKTSNEGNGPVGVIGVLIVPLLLLWFLQNSAAFTNLMFGFFGVLLGVLFLLYCLRYRALDKSIEEMTGEETDSNSNLKDQQVMRELFGDTNVEAENRYRMMARAVVVQANERLFAVLFWFLVFGPMGALMYRMSWYFVEHKINSSGADQAETKEIDSSDSFDSAATKLYGILSWIPARLTSLAYALAGGFEDAFSRWKESDWGVESADNDSNARVLANVGLGAVNIRRYEIKVVADQQTESSTIVTARAVKAARALVLRALLIWGAVSAIMVLAVWIN